MEKINEYYLSNEEPLEAIKDPKNHVQSICVGSKYILVGTRSGDVYELLRPNGNDINANTKKNKDMMWLRIHANDHHVPKVV